MDAKIKKTTGFVKKAESDLKKADKNQGQLLKMDKKQDKKLDKLKKK